MHRLVIGFLLLASLAASTAQAAIFRVGLGGSAGGCTHSRLQDAINAAASTTGPDEIWLVQGYADNAQALTISGQDLTIRGGYENCADPDTSALERTYVNGTGGNAASVFDIQGPGVVSLENLFIVGGDPPSSRNGGGIRYVGSSRAGSVNVLSLRETNVEQNNALEGGGIHFSGGTVPAFLELGTGTIIAHNSAIHRGGGVALVGTARLTATGDRILFIDNHTLDDAQDNADGGGLFVAQPASVDMGLPNFDQFAVFHGNSAAGDGGAIAVSSPDANVAPAVVRLFSTVGDRPFALANNTATNGAAIAIIGTGVAGSLSGRVCLRNVNLLNNTARDGQIVSVSRGAHFGLTRFDDEHCAFPGEYVACAAGIACNVIAGNRANGLTSSFNGWLIVGSNGASMTLRYAIVRDNTVEQSLLYAAGLAPSHLRVLDSLIANNTVDGPLLYLSTAGTLAVVNSTVANNAGTPGGVQWSAVAAFGGANSNVMVRESILEATYHAISLETGVGATIEHVLLNDRGFISGPTVYTGTADFIARNAGDFRLREDSPGVDWAPVSGASNFDLFGAPRGVDSRGVPNRNGPLDLGAFEASTGIFTGSFEGQRFTNPGNQPIPDNNPDGVLVPITVRIGGARASVQARVGVRIIHSFIGDLIVELVAPGGTTYMLHNRVGGGTDNLVAEYPLDLSAEAVDGEWFLRVRDVESLDTGFVDEWWIEP